MLPGRGLPFQQGSQRLALHRARHAEPGRLQQRRGEIRKFDQRLAAQPFPETPRPRNHQRDVHQALVEAAALQQEAVISQRLAVVAGEDDHRVGQLAALLQGVQHPANVVIDQFDHGEVFRLVRLSVEVLRPPRRRLEVDGSQALLRRQVRLAEQRAGHVRFRVVVKPLLRRVERRVRVEAVQAEQPWARALFAQEVDGSVGTPGCLVKLARNVAQPFVDRIVVLAPRAQPLDIAMPFGPVVAGMMAPIEYPVPVVHARLDPALRAGEVKLAGQAAVVAGVCERLGDQGRRVVPGLVPVHAAVHRGRIHAGQEACPAGSADRRLAVGVLERDAARDQTVDVRRADVPVSERADRVPALLVGTDPKDVGAAVCGTGRGTGQGGPAGA